MFSFTRKNKNNKNIKRQQNEEIIKKIQREQRERDVERAYEQALLDYETITEMLKNNNVKYATKKGVLGKYNPFQVGSLYSLPLKQYKELEAELKQLRLQNLEEESIRKRIENQEEQNYINCLRRENENCKRKETNASDPKLPSEEDTIGKITENQKKKFKNSIVKEFSKKKTRKNKKPVFHYENYPNNNLNIMVKQQPTFWSKLFGTTGGFTRKRK